MSGVYWWRSWHGAPMDHKWRVISVRAGVVPGIVSAVAWALMDYASQNSPRGSIEGFDVEEYSVFSGFGEAEIAAVIQAMTDKGMIKDGCFVNWEKRQPAREDDSAERVRKHRALKRDLPRSNAVKHDVTPRLKITDTDTDTEKDTEKEKEPEQEAGAGGLPDLEFAALARQYEENIGMITPATADILTDDLDQYGLKNCQDAIKEAVSQNVRKWSYVRGILARWKTEGRGSRPPGAKPPPAPAVISPRKAALREMLQQEGGTGG